MVGKKMTVAVVVVVVVNVCSAFEFESQQDQGGGFFESSSSPFARDNNNNNNFEPREQAVQQFIYRPERHVVSHQPLLPGRHVGNFGGRGQFKRQVQPQQQLQQTFQRDPNVVQKSPWNLIDPTTGRMVNPQFVQESSALLGLPLEAITDSSRTPFIRNERENALQTNKILGSEYFSSSGDPIYKMKKKYPLGYSGRRRRSAQQFGGQQRFAVPQIQRRQSPWNLIDPLTGRTIDQGFLFQEQPQFQQVRLTRDGPRSLDNELDATLESKTTATIPASQADYLDSQGSPVYRQHKRYPYSG